MVFIHNTPTGVTQIWCRTFMNFGVGLFLLFSGLLSSAQDWHSAKRIIKVIIPYGIWSFVYIVITNIKNPCYIPIAYFNSLILANSAPIIYYIFVYCQFTLIIPLIDKMAHFKVFCIGIVVAPIEIIVMCYIQLCMDLISNKFILYIKSVSCLGWFTYFYLDYLIGNKLFKINISMVKLVPIWLFSIVL